MYEVKNGFYITSEGAEALREVSGKRTKEEVEKVSQEIYEELKKRYRKLNKEYAVNVDSIIYTVERRIGKTTAIIRLAEELGLPIVTEKRFEPLFAKTDVNIIQLEKLERTEKMDGVRMVCHTVLVDEPTDAKRVRKAIEKCVSNWLSPVNILGVQ